MRITCVVRILRDDLPIKLFLAVNGNKYAL